jgi:hypothetical protein
MTLCGVAIALNILPLLLGRTDMPFRLGHFRKSMIRKSGYRFSEKDHAQTKR